MSRGKFDIPYGSFFMTMIFIWLIKAKIIERKWNAKANAKFLYIAYLLVDLLLFFESREIDYYSLISLHHFKHKCQLVVSTSLCIVAFHSLTNRMSETYNIHERCQKVVPTVLLQDLYFLWYAHQFAEYKIINYFF